MRLDWILSPQIIFNSNFCHIFIDNLNDGFYKKNTNLDDVYHYFYYDIIHMVYLDIIK